MSFLTEIVAAKREEVRAAKRRLPEAALLAAPRPARRDFAGGLRRNGLAVIAEIKRASPSKGSIAPHLDLPRLVAAYEAGGAAAISVLTDRKYFGGTLADLAEVRRLTGLPILRKDFIIDPYQVAEASAAGADAILLITACLGQQQLRELLAVAAELSLTPLVEVHDEGELARVAALAIEIIGINNRDLRTFRVDPGTVFRLLPMAPKGTVLVAESGISEPAEAAALARAGVAAILVGETLVRSTDPSATIRLLRGET